MTPERDERLGRELRALPVPPHGPHFFATLARRLSEQAVTPPETPVPRLGPGRNRRGRRLPPLLGLAAAAVVATLLAVSTLVPEEGRVPLGPQPPATPGTRLISAAEVRTRVSTALASLRSLAGRVTIECAVDRGVCSPGAGGSRGQLTWSFVVTGAGDERVSGIGHRDEVAYDATKREQRTVSDVGGGFARVVSNLAAGPPDFTGRPSLLRRDVASVVRAFLASTADVPVTETVEAGRPAWHLAIPVEPNPLAGPGRSGDRLEVAVDRGTGFPLRITETLGGRFLHEVRLADLTVDGPVDASAFTLELPAGAEASPDDAGFRRVDLDGAAAMTGYATLLPDPASLPAGYQRAEVTAAAAGPPTGTEGTNPPSRSVVSVAYRRGFDRIVVTTRAAGGAPRCADFPAGQVPAPCWDDPLASGEGIVDEPQAFTVGSGALAGARAQLVVSVRGVPHVWAVGGGLVVTVAGDASPAELRRMAESFAPAR